MDEMMMRKDEVDDVCDLQQRRNNGNNRYVGRNLVLVACTLMMVLPMAGVDAMDAIPEIGQKVISWGAGGFDASRSANVVLYASRRGLFNVNRSMDGRSSNVNWTRINCNRPVHSRKRMKLPMN